ncbi:hypothetical protein OHV08_28195 [Streptomyces canus]|uniref:hypothetical protein n=1 Tax=Streptomyces canus TaxID=58343 RepID=UPI0032446454
MAADTDLDAILAQLPKPSMSEMLAELEAARRADEARPPQRTIIPEPELPPLFPHPDAGLVRFPCALGCGWKHVVDAFAEDEEPISLPLNASSDEVNRIFNERAERRSATLRASTERAIRDHFAEAHKGQEPPERIVR